MALFDHVLSRPWRNTPPFDGRMAARSRRSRFTLLAGSGPAPARTSAGVRSMEHASRRCGRAGSMPRGPSMSGWPGVHRWPVRSDSTRPVGTKAGRVDRVDRGRSFNQNLSCRWSGLDGHAGHGSFGPRTNTRLGGYYQDRVSKGTSSCTWVFAEHERTPTVPVIGKMPSAASTIARDRRFSILRFITSDRKIRHLSCAR